MATKPTECPKCHNPLVRGRGKTSTYGACDLRVKDDVASRFVTCYKCGCSWTEEYDFSNIIFVDPADDKPETVTDTGWNDVKPTLGKIFGPGG